MELFVKIKTVLRKSSVGSTICRRVCYSENFTQRGTRENFAHQGTGDFAQQGTSDNFTACTATLSVNSTVKRHSTVLRYSVVW